MKHFMFINPKKRVIKRLTEDGYTGFDMHFHTRYSMDGLSRIVNVIKKAKKMGIGLAVTDHNEIKGSTAAIHRNRDVPVIPGIEVTCHEGNHVLAYFYTHDALREFYTKEIMPAKKKNPFRTALTVMELLDKTKEYGGVNSMAHPYAPGVLNIENLNLTKTFIRKIPLIEGINGYNMRRMNKKAIDFAHEHDKNMTGGSDGHTTPELGGVLTFVKGNTTEELLKHIKKGIAKIYGKEEKMLKKMILAIEKEALYIKRSKQKHKAGLLIRSQFGNEYNLIKQRIKSRKIKYFKARHLKKWKN